ncbi:MAG: 50S ribosomal protein L44e [Nanobdellota archaeon]
MKIPKRINRFCPKCGKHTENKVEQAKAKTRSSAKPLSRYSGQRTKKRGLTAGMGNLGKYSMPPIKKRKLMNKKLSRKIDLRYECQECKKKSQKSSGFRAKKFELV